MNKMFPVLLLLLASMFLLYPEVDKPVLAVMDFQSEALSENEIAILSDKLSSELLKTEQFTMIEISQRDALFEEMKFSLSGLADESQAIEIGAMLSAQGLVLATVSRINNGYLLSANLIETETGEILNSTEGEFKSMKSLMNGMSQIARELSGTAIYHKQRITAYSCMGGGVVLAGTGAFFLINGALKLQEVNSAWDTYSSMTTGDISGAYDDYIKAHEEAENSLANSQFIGGLGGTLAGLGLIGFSTWMLFSPPEIENPLDKNSSLAFFALPGSDSFSLSLNLSY